MEEVPAVGDRVVELGEAVVVVGACDLEFAAIAAVRTSQVQGFVKALEAHGLSPSTVRVIYHVASQVFAAAVDDRVIPTLAEVEAMADRIGDR